MSEKEELPRAPSSNRLPRLRFARRVTRKHGATFADAFLEHAWNTFAVFDAFRDTGLIQWPESYDIHDPAQARYKDIEDEIVRRTSEAIEPAIAKAFEKIAREVIERERCRK